MGKVGVETGYAMDGKREKPKSRQSDVVQDKYILAVDDIEVNRIILFKILGSLGAICDFVWTGSR